MKKKIMASLPFHNPTRGNHGFTPFPLPSQGGPMKKKWASYISSINQWYDFFLCPYILIKKFVFFKKLLRNFKKICKGSLKKKHSFNAIIINGLCHWWTPLVSIPLRCCIFLERPYRIRSFSSIVIG